MPKPRVLGNAAAVVVSTAMERLTINQSTLFNVVILIYAGDKDAAAAALQPIADNNALALQVLTLLRAGDIQGAQDLIMDARRPIALHKGIEDQP